MSISDILHSFIESGRMHCFKCKIPVKVSRFQIENKHIFVTFRCHGDEETVPVPIMNLRNLASAQEVHKILETLVPFSPADSSTIEQGGPEKGAKALPDAPERPLLP